MKIAGRRASAALATVACAVWFATNANAAEPGDPFREPLCVGPLANDAPGTDQDRAVMKVIRWPYAIEQPFHVLPENDLPAGQQLGPSVRVVFRGHSGLVLEGPRAEAWDADFELFAAFPRGPAPQEEICERDLGIQLPGFRLTTDPYTGNVFVSNFDGDLLDLLVIGPAGEELVRIRADIFFRAPLPDLSDKSYQKLPRGNRDEYSWFAVDALAGFVDVYRRIGRSAYARFILDAFLVESNHRRIVGKNDNARPRLPFLPARDTAEGSDVPESVDNLRGLRTTYRQVFVPDRPSKGGVSCALMPVLKMLEDRDCRDVTEHVGSSWRQGSCPAYSAMALQTELFRQYPKTMRDRAYAFFEVFEALADNGICAEDYYPMLTDMPVGRTKSLEALSRRAERELSDIMAARDTDVPAGFHGFLENTPGDRMSFERQLPPLCRREMERYRAGASVEPHDLVDIFSVQALFEDALPRGASAELVGAQKQELLLIATRLLRQGMLVGVAGDRDELENHAELAYGWDSTGFLFMDSDAATEAKRRRTVIPREELQRSIAGLAFLRDEVKGVRAGEAQLSRSLEIAPDLAWTHRRLGEIRRDEDRHREAVAALRRAVELDPDNAKTWLALGESLQVIGNFADSVEATRRAIALGVDEAYANAQLGFALHKLGRLAEAEQALRAALSPEYSWEWRQLGWTLFDQGKDEEAELCFRRALEIGPQRPWNHVRLAEFLHYTGRSVEAREVLLAAALEEFDAQDRVWIAQRLASFGLPDDAVPILRTVLGEDPGNNQARLELARIHRRAGDDAEVASVLEPMDRDFPPSLGVEQASTAELIELSYAEALSGQAPTSLETVARLRDRHETLEGDELYELACIHALGGDTGQALDLLAEAFERGFADYRWARRDPDLRSLSEDPRLDRLFEQYGSHER